MNIDNIIPSILKVVANENMNIEDDLQHPDSAKSLDQIINEQKEETIEPKNQSND